jgi:hypothetical protein
MPARDDAPSSLVEILDGSATRRSLLLAPLLAALPLGLSEAEASSIDPTETAITLPDAMRWTSWQGLPPHIGEMATLYGGLDKPGPYLVLMKWLLEPQPRRLR